MAPRNQKFDTKSKRQVRAGTPLSPFARQQAENADRVKPRVVYGDAFIVMEDRQKNTFVFDGTNWVPYTKTIAECRATCQVKELPMMKDKMRYEVREPVE